jgi:hypothetical protein
VVGPRESAEPIDQWRASEGFQQRTLKWKGRSRPSLDGPPATVVPLRLAACDALEPLVRRRRGGDGDGTERWQWEAVEKGSKMPEL